MDLTKFAFTTQDQICDSNITLYGKKLKDAIKERLQTDMESVCRKGNEKERPAIVGQIITKIYQTKCPEGIACTRRVELFLRLFHLNVLIATTLIIALVILLVAHFLPLQSATPPPNETGSKAQVAYSLQPRQFWLWVVTLVVASIFALGHVSYFSRSYGDELLRTFLLIVPPAAT
jgi:hypothetical protein